MLDPVACSSAPLAIEIRPSVALDPADRSQISIRPLFPGRKTRVRKRIGAMSDDAGIGRHTLFEFNTNAISRLAENTTRRMQAGGMKPLNLA
jgi:hypothetical protein